MLLVKPYTFLVSHLSSLLTRLMTACLMHVTPHGINIQRQTAAEWIKLEDEHAFVWT